MKVGERDEESQENSVMFLSYPYNKGIIPAMAVKETFRMGVRDELRNLSFSHNLEQEKVILEIIIEHPHNHLLFSIFGL
ncbi:MAG: hypothetical protein QXS69_03310 [Candidatus Aenigmatarchaeota archaeon]